MHHAKQAKPRYKQVKTQEELMQIAVFHLSTKDLLIVELRNKLVRNIASLSDTNVGTEWLDNVTAKLLDLGYLKTDQHFAQRFAENAYSKELGPSYITQALIKRGLDQNTASDVALNVASQLAIDVNQLAVNRLTNRYPDGFSSISSEKLMAAMYKWGFSTSEAKFALSQHPLASTLQSNLDIKADKADLPKEILKLYNKGKGKTLIIQELKAKRINIEKLDDIINDFEQSGDIDFFAMCETQLAKKKFNLKDYKDKNKAYAYLSRKGFSGEQIKCAFEQSE